MLLPAHCGGSQWTKSLRLILGAAFIVPTLAVGSRIRALSVSPKTINFGSVALGKTVNHTVSVTNTAGARVKIFQILVSGTGFMVSKLSLPLILPGGQSVSLLVSFAPTATGSATGSISVVSNASNSPAAVALSGTAVSLQLTASPGSLSFGSVPLGSSSILPIVVTNASNTTIIISQATATGSGFSVSGPNLPLSLAGGQNTSFSVTFAPTTGGSATGSVSLVSNASDSPLNEPLAATAVHSVALSWIASTSSGIAGYDVYRGTVPGGPYTEINSTPIAGASYTDTTVDGGQTYYYVTTAVASGGAQSAYSNQAIASVPSP